MADRGDGAKIFDTFGIKPKFKSSNMFDVSWLWILEGKDGKIGREVVVEEESLRMLLLLG